VLWGIGFGIVKKLGFGFWDVVLGIVKKLGFWF